VLPIIRAEPSRKTLPSFKKAKHAALEEKDSCVPMQLEVADLNRFLADMNVAKIQVHGVAVRQVTRCRSLCLILLTIESVGLRRGKGETEAKSKVDKILLKLLHGGLPIPVPGSERYRWYAARAGFANRKDFLSAQ
jgi:hypothetical protein